MTSGASSCAAPQSPGRMRRLAYRPDREQHPAVAIGGLRLLAGHRPEASGFAYVLNYQIITSEGVTVASMVTYLPVVAIVLAVLILSESATVTALAGIALVLAGVALTRRSPKPVTDVPQDE